mmetsp:Transcript_5112/g.9621  ORF Transcript_5112/g.9621 Transcript_5112/m.9621 type:complete len:132 (+) Transcript_5112:1208-1603(+)
MMRFRVISPANVTACNKRGQLLRLAASDVEALVPNGHTGASQLRCSSRPLLFCVVLTPALCSCRLPSSCVSADGGGCPLRAGSDTMVSILGRRRYQEEQLRGSGELSREEQATPLCACGCAFGCAFGSAWR